MSFSGLNFKWNNIENTELDIVLVRTSTGTITQSLSSPKTFATEHVKFGDTYFYGSDQSTYNLNFSVMKSNMDEEPFTNEERMDLMRYFCPDNNFHPFISEDFDEESGQQIEFWVQFNKAQFTSFRKNVGVYELEATSNAPYPFSELMTSSFISKQDDNIMQISNNCNTQPFYTPTCLNISLLNDATSFSLRNLNTGKLLEFKDLDKLEKISINSRQEIISNTGKIRIDNFNFGFGALDLAFGINDLEISVDCEIEFQMQYPIQI